MLDQSRVISVAFLQGQRLGNSLLQQTPGVIDGARVRTECTTSPSFPKHKLILRVVTTDQERLTSYWTKMLQRNRNVLQVTGRRCYNGSGTSYKLLDEDVTTYPERLTSYWTKMLQRNRNVLQVTGRRCYNGSGGHRTLLHPPQNTPPKKHTPKHPPPKPPLETMIKYWFGFPPVNILKLTPTTFQTHALQDDNGPMFDDVLMFWGCPEFSDIFKHKRTPGYRV